MLTQVGQHRYSVRQLADMNEEREEFGLASDPTGKFLFAIGGCNSKHTLVSVERYNFATDIWEYATSLDRPLKAIAAVALPDGVYVLGGFDAVEGTYCATVRRLENDKWRKLSSMSTKRGAFSAIALRTCDYIYAIGGFGEHGSPLDSVERYDVAADSWQSVAPLHSKRFMFQACLATIKSDNGKLFHY